MVMKRRTLAAPLLFLVMSFLAGLSHGAESRFAVRGRVIDKETGGAVAGTLIEIENASGGSGYSRVFSDEKGEFTIEDLPSGVSFNLYGEKEGYTSFRRLYWYVETGKEKEFVTLKLSREAVLKCRIRLSDHLTPVKRARITLKPMGWRSNQFSVYEFERETGDNGVVTIDRIPAGAYELVIEKTGYIRERLANLSFLAGKTREMDVALYRPATISGRILLKGGDTRLAGIPIIARGPSAGTSNSNFNASLPYGHSAQFDALTAVDISGGIPVNFSISVPPLVSCCNATVNFCIRYVLTFEDCTVCNILACYQYRITGCPK